MCHGNIRKDCSIFEIKCITLTQVTRKESSPKKLKVRIRKEPGKVNGARGPCQGQSP